MGNIKAQNQIMIQDTLYLGAKIMSATGYERYHYVTVQRGKKETIRYTPDEVNNFFVDGSAYHSIHFPLEENKPKVFMEQILSNGSVKVLYYLNKENRYFFLQNNEADSLQLITEKNNPFKDYLLNEYANCPGLEYMSQYKIKMKKASFRKANRMFSRCNPNLHTRFRYGVFLGVGNGNLSSGVLNKIDGDFHFIAGVYTDIPFYKGISFHPEIYYLKDTYKSEEEENNNFQDGIYNRKSIVLPLQLRYSSIFMKGNFVPYLQAGPLINFCLDKEYKKRSINNNEGEVEIKHDYLSEKSNYFYTGVSVGGGIEYKLNFKHSLYLDIRYNSNFDKEKNNMLFTTLSFNL